MSEQDGVSFDEYLVTILMFLVDGRIHLMAALGLLFAVVCFYVYVSLAHVEKLVPCIFNSVLLQCSLCFLNVSSQGRL